LRGEEEKEIEEEEELPPASHAGRSANWSSAAQQLCSPSFPFPAAALFFRGEPRSSFEDDEEEEAELLEGLTSTWRVKTAAVLLLIEGEGENDADDDEKAAVSLLLPTPAALLAAAAASKARSAVTGLRPQTIVAFLGEEALERTGEEATTPLAPPAGDGPGDGGEGRTASDASKSLAGPSPTSTAETPRRSSRPAAAAQAKRSRTALCTSPGSLEEEEEEGEEAAFEEDREARRSEPITAEVESGALFPFPPPFLPAPPPSSVCVFPPPRGPYAITQALNPPRAALDSGATASA
jgi:hypothetical protein